MEYANLTMNEDEGNSTDVKRLRVKKAVYIATICVIVLFLLIVIVLYVVIPIVFMLSFTVQENLMFTRFGLSRHADSFNLNLTGLRNFYLPVTDYDTNKRLSLGVWHLLPWEIIDKNEDNIMNIDFNEVLANSTYPVLLHFHGTGETRRDGFMMFITLRLFFHVIAFDYRGYGDSSDGVMTETAVVEDCKQVYKWLRSKTNAKIYIWGRSLGASLGLRTATELSQQGIIPTGVVVESAFTTMREEIPVHPFGQIYKWLPWLEATILRPLEKSGFFFNNSKHIVEVPTPVMMFHAEDDSVIPIRLGQKLHQIAKNRNKTLGRVVYHQIPADYNCDHYALYLYPDLPVFILNFLDMFITKQLTNLEIKYVLPNW